MSESYHILIVDDSPEDTLTYRRFLSSEDQNYRVTFSTALTGEEGLQLAKIHSPDCILLDFNLPDMTGLEFLQELPTREGKPSIPVLVLTGQGNESIAVSAIKKGAEDYLVKNNLTQDNLCLAVAGTLTNAALNRSIREHRAHLNISQALNLSSSLSEAASTLVKEIGLGLDWRTSMLWVRNPEQSYLENLEIWEIAGLHDQGLPDYTHKRCLKRGEGLAGKAWESGQPVHFNENDLSETNSPEGFDSHASLSRAIAYPLCLRNEVVAIIEGWYLKKQATTKQASMLSAIGQQITQYLERKHIEKILRQREMEYRLVTNHVPALIASYDEHRHYRLANEPYQEWFQQKEADILGHHAQEVLGEKLYEQVRVYMDQVLSGQIVDFELLTQHPDGTDRWLHATYVPDYEEGHNIRGFFSLVSDVTNQKLTEKRLIHQSQELARSNSELEQFAHIASHDLQEPLRKVQAFSDRLRTRAAKLLGPHELDYLDRMHKATNRMQTLIHDLLAFSRVGTKPQPFQSLGLQHLVAEVLTDLETLIAHVGATVEYDHLPVIEGDPTQIRQLFQNLIGNALKFHKIDSPPLVRIFCEAHSPTSKAASNSVPFYRIGIQDNGIGFEQQYANRIFGVFQRLHGRDEYEGTGIGLSICKKVVERHGGTIDVTSTLGTGTTFWIVLPARQERASGKQSNGMSSTPTSEILDSHPTAPLVGIKE